MGASHFKAQCFGCDIDIRVLKGYMHAGVRVPTKPPADTSKDVTQLPPPPRSATDEQMVTPLVTVDSPDQGKESGEPNRPKKRKKGACTKKLQGDIPRSIWDNFQSYGLPRPEVIRMDNHLFDQHCRTSVVEGMFDAIVTDPPVSQCALSTPD